MNILKKTIGYTISIICFFLGGFSFYLWVKPTTPTYYDYYWAEYWGKTIDEYIFEQKVFDFALFVIFIIISVGIVVYIKHVEKKAIQTQYVNKNDTLKQKK